MKSKMVKPVPMPKKVSKPTTNKAGGDAPPKNGKVNTALEMS